MKRLPILLVLVGFALASCTRPEVVVVDAAGMPIEGATVQPITLSMNGPSKLTDRKGAVIISERGAQPVKWVSVTKKGYQDSGHIEFNRTGSTRVILKR